MSIPVLIETDMGAEAVLGVGLALASKRVDVKAIVAVAGRQSAEAAAEGVAALLAAARMRGQVVGMARAGGKEPAGARQAASPSRSNGTVRASPGISGDGAEHGQTSGARVVRAGETGDARRVYLDAIAAAGGELVVVTLGPLTHLAGLMETEAAALGRVKQFVVMGGAVWAKGGEAGEGRGGKGREAGAGRAAKGEPRQTASRIQKGERGGGGAGRTTGDDPVSRHLSSVEFNFGADPAAAGRVVGSGLPVTVCPMDVTKYISIDESGVAHLAASGSRMGAALAGLLAPAVAGSGDGRVHPGGAAAVGAVIWPERFVRTRLRLDVDGTGRCRPGTGGDKSRHVAVLTAVNAVDLAEDVMEAVCQEAFVV